MKKQRFSKALFLEKVEQSARNAAESSIDMRARMFTAGLCGAVEVDHPDLAKALALGAGMTHL
jgi:hypothetical protein